MSENKKITKLSDLHQTHAKLEQEDEDGNVIPTRLDQLLAGKSAGLNRYGTFDPDEYEGNVNAMNVAELRNESIKRGIVPHTNPEKCRKQLKAAFQKYATSYKQPSYVDSNVNLSKSKRNAVLDVLKAVK